ncbi:MAG: aminoacyl-tRNA hydrolase [Sulfuritalea sp.]|nr:aminoacyl-tRNA hydrolase [Sulfuritalea sp.]
MRLIVGLGNPGAEYAETRHNAGFWLCERLARELGVNPARESRFHGLAGALRAGQASAESLWFLQPQTFMNRSGQSVRALTQFYRIEPAEMLVMHDELDLPPGQMRLKFGGGLGGHNGLKDITAHLGTQDYWRLRIGIGHPGDRNEVVDYVLKPPRKEERGEIDAALDRALLAWPALARGDFGAATQRINTKPESAKKENP